MRQFLKSIPAGGELAIVIGLAFGFLIYISLLAALRHATPILTITVFCEAAALLVLVPFLAVRGWTPKKLGLSPRWSDVPMGIALFLVSFLVWWAVWALTVKLTPAIAQSSSVSAAVKPGLPLLTAIGLSLVNAVYEEVFVCGYIITALKRDRNDYVLAVNVSVAIRLLYHLYRGSLGVFGIIPLGLIFAYWFARTGRLWPVLVAHAALDTVGFLVYAYVTW
ncbi:MAG TPA: CPBP family intramembrane glutamic endopeptidase [Rhizomicrobium sp.]|jgi:membrane protease YdiL (CAAX protease family)